LMLCIETNRRQMAERSPAQASEDTSAERLLEPASFSCS